MAALKEADLYEMMEQAAGLAVDREMAGEEPLPESPPAYLPPSVSEEVAERFIERLVAGL
jgi:hypothetical protein